MDGDALIFSDASAQSQASVLKEAKLPKLTLPHFSGDIKQWTSFWEQYEVVVHNGDLPTVTKFTYLISLLKGDARLAVQGLPLTATHYDDAVSILKQRFGRTERIVFAHMDELLNMAAPKLPKVSALWELYDKLQSHVRGLEALGIAGKQYGVLLTPVILSRLPTDIRMEWARQGENHESDLCKQCQHRVTQHAAQHPKMHAHHAHGEKDIQADFTENIGQVFIQWPTDRIEEIG